MCSFHFYSYNQFKVFPQFRTRKVPIQIFGNVRCSILRVKTNSTLLIAVLMRPGDRYMEEKQTELETEK